MKRREVFILLELFTFRNVNSKKYKYEVLADFRHIMTCYISNSTSYSDFRAKLTKYCLSCDKEIFSLCRSFARYLNVAYGIWHNERIDLYG